MRDDVTALLLIAGNLALTNNERLQALATFATFSPQGPSDTPRGRCDTAIPGFACTSSPSSPSDVCNPLRC